MEAAIRVGAIRWHGSSAAIATAIACLLGACSLIVVMGALARVLGDDLPAPQIAFLRFVIALPVLLAIVSHSLGKGWGSLPLLLHLLRGGAIALALAAAFYGFARMPLSDVTALLFLEPILLVLFAARVHRQRLNGVQLGAVGLGLCGALLILRPSFEVVSYPGLVVVFSAAAAAAVALLTRRLATRGAEGPLLSLGALIPALVLGPIALWSWVAPSADQWVLIGALAMAGLVGQWLIIQAYRRAEPALLAPVEYSQLPLAMLLGLVVFGDTVPLSSLFGVILIVAAPMLLRASFGELPNGR